MASAMNHQKRSHKIEPIHRSAVAQMQKFLPRDYIKWLRKRFNEVV